MFIAEITYDVAIQQGYVQRMSFYKNQLYKNMSFK